MSWQVIKGLSIKCNRCWNMWWWWKWWRRKSIGQSCRCSRRDPTQLRRYPITLKTLLMSYSLLVKLRWCRRRIYRRRRWWWWWWCGRHDKSSSSSSSSNIEREGMGRGEKKRPRLSERSREQPRTKQEGHQPEPYKKKWFGGSSGSWKWSDFQ